MLEMSLMLRLVEVLVDCQLWLCRLLVVETGSTTLQSGSIGFNQRNQIRL